MRGKNPLVVKYFWTARVVMKLPNTKKATPDPGSGSATLDSWNVIFSSLLDTLTSLSTASPLPLRGSIEEPATGAASPCRSLSL